MKKLIWLLIVAPFIASIMIGIHLYILFTNPYEGKDAFFTVKAGEGFSSINHRLYKEGITSNPRLFHHYTNYKGLLTKFKAGTFVIKHGSTMPDVLRTLVNGVAIAQKITIPEGKNIFELGKIFEEQEICKAADFVAAARDPELLKKFHIEADSFEGYLYPETYQFDKNTPAPIIIKNLYLQFENKTKELLTQNDSSLSSHEVVTLASIVEKETGASFERPIIAGVFLNRLKKRMRLQSDPTTIYGIYENFNGNLRKKHLEEVTPYNTYRIAGLPKGPIANPGISAIKAVLNPEKHNFLYFVSKNDGTHVFSANYKDHRQAVEKWQKVRSNRIGKSWRNLKENSQK